MNYKVGDRVICVKEDDFPEFIGTEWVIYAIIGKTFKVQNISHGLFTFMPDEIVLCSSLHEVLA
jgi:hypothetical protein